VAGVFFFFLLFLRQQIEEQCAYGGIVQGSRNVLVARTVTAASAPVRKEDNTARSCRDVELAFQLDFA
jgi:hypothetical protein